MVSQRYLNKGVAITGGARGIGYACAENFAQEAAKVIVLDSNAEALNAAVAKLADAGLEVYGVVGDATNTEDVNRFAIEAETRLGKVDVLVNNVGGARGPGHSQWFWEIEFDDFLRMEALNVHSTFLCSSRLVSSMKECNHGVIVNIASTAGLLTDPGHSHYGAFKAAVIQLTKGMAVDLAPHGVRVNCVAPGEIRTNKYEDVNWERTFELKIPMLRAGRPDEIAKVVSFLASDDASYMTGTIVVVDGGLTAKE